MNNVLDYLKWRGDVPMTGSPFNEIDNIILSMTTFVDFTDIVPSDPSGEPVSFPAAMKRFDQGDAGQKNTTQIFKYPNYYWLFLNSS